MKPTKSKKVKVINEKTMIAALDIGKTAHYAYFRAPNGKDIKPFPFFTISEKVLMNFGQGSVNSKGNINLKILLLALSLPVRMRNRFFII